MALTERTVEDRFEVMGEFRHVQVRRAVIIERDGKEISRSFHRLVVGPDSDTTKESKEVKAICAAVHTQEVREAYAAHREAQLSEISE